MGSEATWRDTSWPPGWGMWTRNTSRTRVFFRPMSVSPFLSSMSAFLSFRIPTQSILGNPRQNQLAWSASVYYSSGHIVLVNHCSWFSLFVSIKPCQKTSGLVFIQHFFCHTGIDATNESESVNKVIVGVIPTNTFSWHKQPDQMIKEDIWCTFIAS